MRPITLTFAALAWPFVAQTVWAATDCGNPPVQVAEVTHKIKTPQQFDAMVPAALKVMPAILPVEPTITESSAVIPPVVKRAQVESSKDISMPAVASPVQAYATLLQRRISSGDAGLNLFDYAGAHSAGELADVTAYLDYLAGQNPDVMVEADQIAYWANLYNALTLKVVLENYPVSSIRKIKSGAFSVGPWKRDAVTVNGEVISLDTIEHKILRQRYDDPALVHYMVNCASIGCPNLSNKLWDGAMLDADRDQAARDFINSPRGVAINGGKLKVSSIYNWFKEDFGGSKSATLDHFRKYAGPDLKAALDAGAKIDGYDYDWTLNE